MTKHKPGPKNYKNNNMDKVKIKRVGKAKKQVSTKEKILAGLGLGSTLLGGAGAIMPKEPSTQFVRTQDKDSKTGESTVSKIKSALKSMVGIKEAKAALTPEEEAQRTAMTNRISELNQMDFSGTLTDDQRAELNNLTSQYYSAGGFYQQSQGVIDANTLNSDGTIGEMHLPPPTSATAVSGSVEVPLSNGQIVNVRGFVGANNTQMIMVTLPNGTTQTFGALTDVNNYLRTLGGSTTIVYSADTNSFVSSTQAPAYTPVTPTPPPPTNPTPPPPQARYSFSVQGVRWTNVSDSGNTWQEANVGGSLGNIAYYNGNFYNSNGEDITGDLTAEQQQMLSSFFGFTSNQLPTSGGGGGSGSGEWTGLSGGGSTGTRTETQTNTPVTPRTETGTQATTPTHYFDTSRAEWTPNSAGGVTAHVGGDLGNISFYNGQFYNIYGQEITGLTSEQRATLEDFFQNPSNQAATYGGGTTGGTGGGTSGGSTGGSGYGGGSGGGTGGGTGGGGAAPVITGGTTNTISVGTNAENNYTATQILNSNGQIIGLQIKNPSGTTVENFTSQSQMLAWINSHPNDPLLAEVTHAFYNYGNLTNGPIVPLQTSNPNAYQVYRDSFGNGTAYFGELGGQVYFDATNNQFFLVTGSGSSRLVTNITELHNYSTTTLNQIRSILNGSAPATQATYTNITPSSANPNGNLLNDISTPIRNLQGGVISNINVGQGTPGSSNTDFASAYNSALRNATLTAMPGGGYMITVNGTNAVRTFSSITQLNQFLENSFRTTDSFLNLSENERLIAVAAIQARLVNPAIGQGMPTLPQPNTGTTQHVTYIDNQGNTVQVNQAVSPVGLSFRADAEWLQRMFPGSSIVDAGYFGGTVGNAQTGEGWSTTTGQVNPNLTDSRRNFELVLPNGTRINVGLALQNAYESNGITYIAGLPQEATQYFRATPGETAMGPATVRSTLGQTATGGTVTPPAGGGGGTGGGAGGIQTPPTQTTQTPALTSAEYRNGSLIISGSNFNTLAENANKIEIFEGTARVREINASAGTGNSIIIPVTLQSGTTYTVKVTAHTRVSNSVTFTVGARVPGSSTTTQAPVIETTSLPAGRVGTPYTATLSGRSVGTWGASGLPAGLTINHTTGVISGTPTAATTVPARVTITASRGDEGPSTTREFTITIQAAPTTSTTAASISTSTLPAAVAGVAYTGPALTATGFTGTVTWSFITPQTGMTINSSTGVISWASPTVGTRSIPVRATSGATVVDKTFILTVNPAAAANAPTITTTTLINATAGRAYTATLTGTNITGGRWALTNAPSWLDIDPNAGVISARSPVAGTYNFKATVTVGTRTDDQDLRLVVAPAVATNAPTITTSSLPAGVVGTNYTTTTLTGTNVTATGWSATGLPAGLTLTSAGVLSGRPTAATTSPARVVVTARNSANQTITREYTINIAPAPATTASSASVSRIVVENGQLKVTVSGVSAGTRLTPTLRTTNREFNLLSVAVPAPTAGSSVVTFSLNQIPAGTYTVQIRNGPALISLANSNVSNTITIPSAGRAPNMSGDVALGDTSDQADVALDNGLVMTASAENISSSAIATQTETEQTINPRGSSASSDNAGTIAPAQRVNARGDQASYQIWVQPDGATVAQVARGLVIYEPTIQSFSLVDRNGNTLQTGLTSDQVNQMAPGLASQLEDPLATGGIIIR